MSVTPRHPPVGTAPARASGLVIHGHFYQPLRENPWTGQVPEEPTAAPFHDWNERITHECYRPNAWVEVAPGQVVNAFEHLSFDLGPTLAAWLEAHHRDVYDRILDADRRTGTAIAQAWGHAILPLCNEADLRTQVRWGIADFRHRFGRHPDGMWLPETAVSDAVLRVLADERVRFTLLAPAQIAATRRLGTDRWVDHGDLRQAARPEAPPASPGRYRWRHPDGSERGVDLVVYDGVLAHALAFGHPTVGDLLDAAAASSAASGWATVAATDGETFGHHHPGAEVVVARALAVEAGRQGGSMPRLVDLLDAAPPTSEARVRTSAWSCQHGVGRWMAHCGCHTGGEPGWNQAWREPLRNALDLLRDWAADVLDRRGRDLFHDPWVARDVYGEVLAGATSVGEHLGTHLRPGGSAAEALTLLDAQRHAISMYMSCAWFFNDLAGSETVQVLCHAARAMDLHRDVGEEPPVGAFLDVLGQARSNDPSAGDGRRIWAERVDTSRPVAS